MAKKIREKSTITDKSQGKIFYKTGENPVLADMFEKFRNNSLKNYGLCPSHYLSTPGLSWNAMLKMTKIELELISDPDMHIVLEKGSRGRISYISKIQKSQQ